MSIPAHRLDLRGFLDRVRAERRAAQLPWTERMGRDLAEAASIGDARQVELPLTSRAAQTLSERLATRDQRLELRGMKTPSPRCVICDFELAAPFRALGVHPECAPSSETELA